jgi:clan AA aspartic protease
MGITYVPGTVTGPAGSSDLDFLVDSGAQYTLLPEDVWQKIGLTAKRTQRFRLADGSEMSRGIGTAVVDLKELGETPTPIILGQIGDVALLGAVTLEELGLVLNPFTRTLHPAALLLV